MCVVISERATSVVCVCGTDRRECVCVLLLATPNTLVLDSRYPRERDWTDVRAVDLQTDDIQQLLVPKEAEVGSLQYKWTLSTGRSYRLRAAGEKFESFYKKVAFHSTFTSTYVEL